MEKETILFDLDDVIVVPNLLKIANRITGQNKKIEEFKEYYFEKGFNFTSEQREQFYDSLVTENLYDNAKLIDGAYELLMNLSKEPHFDVYIASDSVIYKRETLSAKVFADKFSFIIEKLPFINPRNIILSGDKSMLCAKWMVDDKLENLEKNNNVKYKLLFPAYHNYHISDEELIQKNIVRVKNHEYVERFIKGNLTQEERLDIINKVFNLCYRDVNISIVKRNDCILIYDESKTAKSFLGEEKLEEKLNKLLDINVNIL